MSYQRRFTIPLEAGLELIQSQWDQPMKAERIKIVDPLTMLATPVYVTSMRIRTFVHSGPRCKCCGLEGSHFAIERNQKDKKTKEFIGAYHMNLYGYDENGDEVMLTQDHIIPKYKLGSNTLWNSQTLCSPCNQRKSNKIVN